MTETMRAPLEVERTMLAAVNRELRVRGATDILKIEMSPEVRGECLVFIVTPNIGKPFELLLPFVQAFPQWLETMPPQGHA